MDVDRGYIAGLVYRGLYLDAAIAGIVGQLYVMPPQLAASFIARRPNTDPADRAAAERAFEVTRLVRRSVGSVRKIGISSSVLKSPQMFDGPEPVLQTSNGVYEILVPSIQHPRFFSRNVVF
jgi:hypothetical protein